MDYTLLLIVVLLVVIGLVILYSTSAYNGQVKFHDSFYYLKKQAFATVLGIVLMLFVAGMDYHIWQRLAVFGYLAAVALSVAVMLFGREINGSKRWLALGPFSFQPSEFAKVALILFLADLVTKNVKTIGKMWTLCRIMFWILPIVGLVGASNLSTAIIILGIGVILIFVSCHNQYCKEMIEVQPYAFIDKPVSEEKLEKILKRVFETHLNSDDSYCFSYNKRQYNIPLNQIRFFQSDKRIVQINAVQLDMPELEYLFYGKLEEVERNLRKANVKFLRIRKSLLVNTRFIKEYSADRVVLDNGREVEISKNYRDHVRQHYISMLKGRRWE